MNFYGFLRMPFDKDFESPDAFPSPSLANAVAMLSLGVECEDILLISGPIGSGKSVALRSFIAALDPIASPRSTSAASAFPPQTSLSRSFSPPRGTALQLCKGMRPVIQVHCPAPPQAVVAIDDAQDMKESALLSVKNLVNFDSDSKSKITFVLCGQPELKETLRYSRLASVHQRIRHWVEFSARSLKDSCEYIDHAVAHADNHADLLR